MDAQFVPTALAGEITTSPETAALTVALLEDRLRGFVRDASGARATIAQLDDALSQLAAPLAGELASLGALTLPVQAAWKATTALVGKVLTEASGSSVDTWLTLLSAGRSCFDDYLGTLAAVAAMTPDAGEAELELLAAAKSSTRAWVVAMRPVADFARLLDATLTELTRRSNAQPDKAVAQPAAGWRAQVQRAQHVVGEAVDSTAERLHLSRAEMMTLMLGPLQDARGRAAALPGELTRLHGEVERLTDLLELIEAQLRTRLGQGSAGEQEVAALVFAVAVRVPRLVADLAETRAELTAVSGYLDGLERLAQDRAVRQPAAEALRREYSAARAVAQERLTALEERAASWRQHGDPLFQDALGWIDQEVEVANLRLGLGQWSQAEADVRLRQLQRRDQAVRQARELLRRPL